MEPVKSEVVCTSVNITESHVKSSKTTDHFLMITCPFCLDYIHSSGLDKLPVKEFDEFDF